MPLSIFVYNKTQRPLKINCNIMWISPLSIYPDRKKTKSLIRIKTPQKY